MGRHYSDLKSRVGQFIAAGFSKRYPETVTRQEILDYVRNISDAEPRTKRKPQDRHLRVLQLARPKNHSPRWDRIRVLAAMDNREEADRLARLPIKHLLRLSEVGEIRRREPL
jgi:hypothetical protein